jgi:hypothetical protein
VVAGEIFQAAPVQRKLIKKEPIGIFSFIRISIPAFGEVFIEKILEPVENSHLIGAEAHVRCILGFLTKVSRMPSTA